ncbi:hypothetical protein CsSME_00027919 [Camellia sinensis var. sinensis]
MWSSILIPRKLFIGTLNPRVYKCISEAYYPSQYGRQFGLTQGIPIPLCSLSNLDLTTRELKVPKTRLDEANLKLIEDLEEFEFISFIPQGKALKRFQVWWTANMEVHLAIAPKDLLKGLDMPSQVKPKETGIIITSTVAPATSSPPPRVTRATLKKETTPEVHSRDEEEKEAPLKRKKKTFSSTELVMDLTYKATTKPVEKEQTKKIIVFQRSEKRRQQQILKEEAIAAEARKKEAMRKSKTTKHYALCSSPIITTTTTEAGNFPQPLVTLIIFFFKA